MLNGLKKYARGVFGVVSNGAKNVSNVAVNVRFGVGNVWLRDTGVGCLAFLAEHAETRRKYKKIYHSRLDRLCGLKEWLKVED